MTAATVAGIGAPEALGSSIPMEDGTLLEQHV
jgi:hypothetical protein